MTGPMKQMPSDPIYFVDIPKIEFPLNAFQFEWRYRSNENGLTKLQ